MLMYVQESVVGVDRTVVSCMFGLFSLYLEETGCAMGLMSAVQWSTAHLYRFHSWTYVSHVSCCPGFPPVPLFGLVAIIIDLFCWTTGDIFKTSINSEGQCR